MNILPKMSMSSLLQFWTVMVQTKFTGRARQVYNNLSSEDSKDYETVKKTVLLAYDQVAETYRQRFRKAQKPQTSTYIEYMDDLSRLFDKWLKSLEVTTFNSLRELMLSDQFKFRVPPEIKTS